MQPNDILAAYAADMPRDRQWTLDETRTVMKRMALAQTTAWAEATWQLLLTAREMLSADVENEIMTRDEANGQLKQVLKMRVADMERLFGRIAANIGGDGEDREAFAKEVGEAFNSRCADLIAATPIGVTGRA